MPTVVQVGTTFDSPSTYDRLFEAYDEAISAIRDDKVLVLDFDGCTFLHQTAVAFLGGLIREVQRYDCLVQVRLGTLLPAVRSNLRKNGFLQAFGFETRAGGNNTIPFRQDVVKRDDALVRYVQEEWLGRGWVDVSDRVKNAIATAVWEIYSNAFEHGASETGVFSCGQFYPNKREIALCIVDFGVGIPASVRTVAQAAHLDDAGAIDWAVARGNTSKPGNRGVGLDILREFIQINKGRMDMLSHRGHVNVTSRGQMRSVRNHHFPGTIVNITLKADEQRYVFQDELDAENIF